MAFRLVSLLPSGIGLWGKPPTLPCPSRHGTSFCPARSQGSVALPDSPMTAPKGVQSIVPPTPTPLYSFHWILTIILWGRYSSMSTLHLRKLKFKGWNSTAARRRGGQWARSPPSSTGFLSARTSFGRRRLAWSYLRMVRRNTEMQPGCNVRMLKLPCKCTFPWGTLQWLTSCATWLGHSTHILSQTPIYMLLRG